MMPHCTCKIKSGLLFLLVMMVIGFTSCRHSPPELKKKIITFRPIYGISYTEVYRRMKNGFSFSKYGYQLEPQWKMQFLSDDSMSVYSPDKKRFLVFPLTCGYDSIFNTASAWFKLKKMSKDSLVVEIIKSDGFSLEIQGSSTYMTFYADKYTKNVLHTDTATLRRPSRGDTLFIKSLVAKANRNNKDAFAARQPVQLNSKSPLVRITQRKTTPNLSNHFDTSDDYLDPEFTITIKKAYQDFSYSFSVYVDPQGIMHYGAPLIGFMDAGFRKNYIDISKAIMDSYLKLYVSMKPGSTLGIVHTSLISVNVIGIKSAK